MSGVAGCPKQMFDALGGLPYENYQELELQISLYPAAIYNPACTSPGTTRRRNLDWF